MTAVYFTFRRRPPRPRQLLEQPMSPLKDIDMRNPGMAKKQELDKNTLKYTTRKHKMSSKIVTFYRPRSPFRPRSHFQSPSCHSFRPLKPQKQTSSYSN